MSHVATRSGVPVAIGARWAFAECVFLESFMDELAGCQTGSAVFRRSLGRCAPAQRCWILPQARDRGALPAGRARGITHESFGSIVQVEVYYRGAPRVHRVVRCGLWYSYQPGGSRWKARDLCVECGTAWPHRYRRRVVQQEGAAQDGEPGIGSFSETYLLPSENTGRAGEPGVPHWRPHCKCAVFTHNKRLRTLPLIIGSVARKFFWRGDAKQPCYIVDGSAEHSEQILRFAATASDKSAEKKILKS